MKIMGYYPGCSLHGGGLELELSLKAVARVAGVELREIEDWSCCGATAAHSLNHELGVALPCRNLALAQQQGLTEIVVPCAACFSRLKGTAVRLGRNAELAEKMAAVVGRPFSGNIRILNAIEFVNQLLADGLATRLIAPLSGLKVAAYYGCLLSRGEGIVENDHPELPTGMEPAIRACGCEAVPWNFATECCGGGFSMSLTKAVVELSKAILADAAEAGAAAIVTSCPMCHSNLDMRQAEVAKAGGPGNLPVIYLTELLGLAAGVRPQELGLNRHFVDAMPLAGGTR